MTFITRTFSEFTPSELELLKVTPPTAESRALANRVGQRMGEYAYPGDMVRESVTYEAGQNGWPNEIAVIIQDLAWKGLQRI